MVPRIDTSASVPRAVLPSYTEVRRAFPALRSLETEAKNYQDDVHARFCANEKWYGSDSSRHSLRNRTVRIADRAVQKYCQQRVYDLIYDQIYGLLPDCRGGCGCFDRGDVA